MLVRVSTEDAEIETGVKQVACPDTAGKAAPRQGHQLWIWDCSGDGSNSHLMAQTSAGYRNCPETADKCIDHVLSRAESLGSAYASPYQSHHSRWDTFLLLHPPARCRCLSHLSLTCPLHQHPSLVHVAPSLWGWTGFQCSAGCRGLAQRR